MVGMKAGVGLEHCQRDTDTGGGHRGLGNEGDDNVGILKALRMVGAVTAIIWNILLIPCLNKSYVSYKGKECGLRSQNSHCSCKLIKPTFLFLSWLIYKMWRSE